MAVNIKLEVWQIAVIILLFCSFALFFNHALIDYQKKCEEYADAKVKQVEQQRPIAIVKEDFFKVMNNGIR